MAAIGPYVTDGETNASLRTGDDVETLTFERARRADGRPARARAGQAEAPRRTRLTSTSQQADRSIAQWASIGDTWRAGKQRSPSASATVGGASAPPRPARGQNVRET